MRLSNRITGLTGGGSDGWDLFNKARRMMADGVSVTELTIGEHDVRTDPVILDEMHRSAKSGHTGYSAIPGMNSLRVAIAERVQSRTGVPTQRENVVICPGGQAALFASHMAVCDPGDTALYIDPYYATFPGTVRGAGAKALAAEAKAENGFQPDPADIAAVVPDATSLLVNSPNNPTGAVYSREVMEGIADVCIEHDIWLISDEVYDTQLWQGTHLSARTLPDMAERTLVCGSLSKSHAMTGSRLGWVVAPEEVIAGLITLVTHTTYGLPGYIQDAGLFALGLGEKFEEKIAAPFKRRHAVAKALLAKHGVTTVPSNATMYLMADIRATGLSGDDFADGLLETHHIAVMPGESFGKAAAGHVRIALTVEDEKLLSALEIFASFYASCLSAKVASV